MKPKLNSFLILFIFLACTGNKDFARIEGELQSLDLATGEITLCGSGADQFGDVSFSFACSEQVRADFNLATALLHSFEYTEAEKVFARVVNADPRCVMGYWGIAMANFHPLWAPPAPEDLTKGAKVIALARSLIEDKSTRESDYLEAVATMYDNWETLDHRTRLLKFESASKKVFENYPDDTEAAIFYALALGAGADPADKTFQKQKLAGEILNRTFDKNPNHPGIAHYIIHTYDYPELAELGLPAARKYASIAAASAHAQHMPSHIFVRLGLWDEAIQSNMKSMAAAQCYAQQSGIKGHWDEELHGLDYLVYAHLQKGEDSKALELVNYLDTVTEVFPVNFKDAYCFAAVPARYAIERKDWKAAAELELHPKDFPWKKFLWERANVNFARLLGAVHLRRIDDARNELSKLQSIYDSLSASKEQYKANLVMIQIKASKAWIRFAENKTTEAVALMKDAAEMEEATAKHPVTPGEIIPARELLGDLFLAMGDPANAIKAYEDDLRKHPNKFNGLFGAAVASEKTKNVSKAKQYYQKLLLLAQASTSDRPQLVAARTSASRL